MTNEERIVRSAACMLLAHNVVHVARNSLAHNCGVAEDTLLCHTCWQKDGAANNDRINYPQLLQEYVR